MNRPAVLQAGIARSHLVLSCGLWYTAVSGGMHFAYSSGSACSCVLILVIFPVYVMVHLLTGTKPSI
jgi:hypothetical protein